MIGFCVACLFLFSWCLPLLWGGGGDGGVGVVACCVGVLGVVCVSCSLLFVIVGVVCVGVVSVGVVILGVLVGTCMFVMTHRTVVLALSDLARPRLFNTLSSMWQFWY